MRDWLISGLSVAAGLALVLATSGYAQSVPGYDGTGSAFASGSTAANEDAKADAKLAADERDRQKLTQQVAAGKLYALVPLAGKLQYGNANHPADEAGALDLYQRAADAGNPVGLGKMCVAYLLGEGRPRDTTKGLAYCNALTDNSPSALFGKGYAAHEGIGEKADLVAATDMFTKAVAAGSGPAADILGRDALAAGKPDEARNWFRKGVYRESVDALGDLARMAEAGQGGGQDLAEAYWLYVNAARHGDAGAAAWVAAHPDLAPLKRIVLEDGRSVMAITEVYTDRKGVQRTASLDGKAIEVDLIGYWPMRAAHDHAGGVAFIDCYVNAAHQIDVCWLRREDPPGYDFGHILEQFYEGQLTVADTDAVGEPTAQRVFVFGIEWEKPW